MLQINDLTLRAQDRLLVDRLQWRVRPGECWSIIGKNGAGKTTLLRTLSGMRELNGGSILLNGRPVADWPLMELAQVRSFLPQSQTDAFGYRAIETVLAARHPYHGQRYWENEADRRAAFAAMQDMDVADLAARDVRSLSGGERQRVAISALLAQDTPLMLMDEPATALDLAHQARLMELLARLCRERGKTLIMAVHDLNLTHGLATHALLLHGDGGWQAGTVSEMMTPERLSHCLGHPVEVVRHGARDVYIAVGAINA